VPSRFARRFLERKPTLQLTLRQMDRHEQETVRSYADLLTRAQQFAGGLQALGLAPDGIGTTS